MIQHQAPISLSLSDGIATLRLCDNAGMNALSPALVTGFTRAMEAIDGDETVRAVILCGGAQVFCAGAAREVLDGILEGDIAVEELGLPRRLLACPVPVIAAMRGSAVGGGFALGLAADVVILAEQARYGLNFMDLGLTPGMGATWLAGEKLGAAVADELMYTTEYRRGRHFRGLGALNHIVPAEAVEPLAQDLAARIAGKPRAALTLLKANQTAHRLVAFDAARAAEMAMHRTRLADPETAARIRGNYVD